MGDDADLAHPAQHAGFPGCEFGVHGRERLGKSALVAAPFRWPFGPCCTNRVPAMPIIRYPRAGGWVGGVVEAVFKGRRSTVDDQDLRLAVRPSARGRPDQYLDEIAAALVGSGQEQFRPSPLVRGSAAPPGSATITDRLGIRESTTTPQATRLREIRDHALPGHQHGAVECVASLQPGTLPLPSPGTMNSTQDHAEWVASSPWCMMRGFEGPVREPSISDWRWAAENERKRSAPCSRKQRMVPPVFMEQHICGAAAPVGIMGKLRIVL